jgi:hypothetical protein
LKTFRELQTSTKKRSQNSSQKLVLAEIEKPAQLQLPGAVLFFIFCHSKMNGLDNFLKLKIMYYSKFCL